MGWARCHMTHTQQRQKSAQGIPTEGRSYASIGYMGSLSVGKEVTQAQTHSRAAQ